MAQRNGRPKQTEQPRQPVPSNVALERELLGACFFNERCSLAFERLDERDFFDELHQKIYAAIKTAWKNGTPFQTGGFLHELTADWPLEERDVAIEMLRNAGPPSNIPRYCTVLRELRLKRAAVHISEQLMNAALDRQVTPEEWAAQARDWLEKLAKVKP